MTHAEKLYHTTQTVKVYFMSGYGYANNRQEYEPFKLIVQQAETICSVWTSCSDKYDTFLHFFRK